MELIATLPSIHRQPLLRQIISHPQVTAVRYNTGVQTGYEFKDILAQLVRLSKDSGKKLFVDLKGRQLRIEQWADPLFGKVVLNHKLTVDCPATIVLRGDETSKVVKVDGNVIYLDPPPQHALGAGQAINIHGTNMAVDGYLTDDDYRYLQAALELGVRDFMLSFVECDEDIEIVRMLAAKQTDDPLNLVLKIESPKGIEFIRNKTTEDLRGLTVMAARDDMFINAGSRKFDILTDLEMLVQKNPQAILASRIFSGLEQSGQITLADISDIRLMQTFGYKRFMLSDGICARHFDAAIRAWQDYLDFLGRQSHE